MGGENQPDLIVPTSKQTLAMQSPAQTINSSDYLEDFRHAFEEKLQKVIQSINVERYSTKKPKPYYELINLSNPDNIKYIDCFTAYEKSHDEPITVDNYEKIYNYIYVIGRFWIDEMRMPKKAQDIYLKHLHPFMHRNIINWLANNLDKSEYEQFLEKCLALNIQAIVDIDTSSRQLLCDRNHICKLYSDKFKLSQENQELQNTIAQLRNTIAQLQTAQSTNAAPQTAQSTNAAPQTTQTTNATIALQATQPTNTTDTKTDTDADSFTQINLYNIESTEYEELSARYNELKIHCATLERKLSGTSRLADTDRTVFDLLQQLDAANRVTADLERQLTCADQTIAELRGITQQQREAFQVQARALLDKEREYQLFQTMICPSEALRTNLIGKLKEEKTQYIDDFNAFATKLEKYFQQDSSLGDFAEYKSIGLSLVERYFNACENLAMLGDKVNVLETRLVRQGDRIIELEDQIQQRDQKQSAMHHSLERTQELFDESRRECLKLETRLEQQTDELKQKQEELKQARATITTFENKYQELRNIIQRIVIPK